MTDVCALLCDYEASPTTQNTDDLLHVLLLTTDWTDGH